MSGITGLNDSIIAQYEAVSYADINAEQLIALGIIIVFVFVK